MRRRVIALCLSAVLCGCQSVRMRQCKPHISVTLHPITHSPFISNSTDSWLITDASQRDWIPDQAMVGPRGVTFVGGWNAEVDEWKDNYTAQVDLIVKITNTSTQELILFEEWNSWGYYNLKFVFDNGGHEYWVTKQRGLWYRNFPSWHALAPGESFQIPVAFADHIWSNLDQIRANANQIGAIRAVYERHHAASGPLENAWRGSQSSRYYPAADLLPRFGFRKTGHMPDVELRFIAPSELDVELRFEAPRELSEPDEIDIDILGEDP